MFVYNLRKEKYAGSLMASGVANRWNRAEEFVIYTGSSRALAMLESLVHRNSITLKTSYKMLMIDLDIQPGDILHTDPGLLRQDWTSLNYYPVTQEIGSAWYSSQKELVLQVPSAIIPQEYNLLINTRHPDFGKKVTIHRLESFEWDQRLLSDSKREEQLLALSN